MGICRRTWYRRKANGLIPGVEGSIVDQEIPAGTDVRVVTPEVLGQVGNPVVMLVHRLQRQLRGQSNPSDIAKIAAALSHTASAMKTVQAMATHSEVRAIVELVDPYLDESARGRLATILVTIDRRAGMAL